MLETVTSTQEQWTTYTKFIQGSGLKRRNGIYDIIKYPSHYLDVIKYLIGERNDFTETIAKVET